MDQTDAGAKRLVRVICGGNSGDGMRLEGFVGLKVARWTLILMTRAWWMRPWSRYCWQPRHRVARLGPVLLTW